MSPPATLRACAEAVLRCPDPAEKTKISRDFAARWQSAPFELGTATPPDFPARPDAPELVAPRDVPRPSAPPLSASLAEEAAPPTYEEVMAMKQA